MRGANRSLLEVLRLRLNHEFDCTVALPPGDGPFVPPIEESGIRTVCCEQPYWVTSGAVDHWLYCMRQLPAAVKQMREIIRRYQIDLVFTNCGQCPVGALAAALEGRPHVWYLQECFLNPATGLRSPPGQPVLARCVGELSSSIMVVSESVKAEYAPYVAGRLIRVVPSGIEVDRYANSRPVDTVRRILTVGTTSPAKGLDDLIGAVELLNARGHTVQVDVLGSFDDVDYERTIKKRIRDGGMSDAIKFHGWREDSPVWYAKADLVCCPSHAESFGRSVVEGMAAGRVVVATRCGGPEEIVVDGETGLLVPPGDATSLTDALERLVANPEIARTMGAKGQARARALYDINSCTDAWLDMISQALGSPCSTLASTGIAELLLAFIEGVAPRMLLGRKYKMISTILRAIDHPI